MMTYEDDLYDAYDDDDGIGGGETGLSGNGLAVSFYC